MKHTELLEKYKDQSIHYLKNAYKSIDAGDVEKAGEFLWGSMAEAIKAVAATKGVTFRGHRQVRDYAESLSKELGDKSIFDHFLHAESLHSNFYECELEMKDVIRVAEEVRMTVSNLHRLIAEQESSSEA